MKPKDIQRLQHIAALRYQIEQSHMARLAQKEAKITAQIQSLNAVAKTQDHAIDVTNGYTRSGALLAWQTWVSQSRNALNRELAQTRAQKENQKGKLRKSFGQKHATDALQNAALVQHKKTAQRKAERD